MKIHVTCRELTDTGIDYLAVRWLEERTFDNSDDAIQYMDELRKRYRLIMDLSPIFTVEVVE